MIYAFRKERKVNMANKNIKCSFCGKSQEGVDRIIAGPGVYICNECIKVCSNILEDELYLRMQFILEKTFSYEEENVKEGKTR